MLAGRLARKLCLVLLLLPLCAQAGELRISIRLPCFIPALLAWLFPPPPPLPPSEHHIGLEREPGG